MRLAPAFARLALAAVALPAAAAAAPPEWCASSPGVTAIVRTQEHVAARLQGSGPLTIVAVGSSSTVGVGASDPSLGYPSRLEAELRQRFPAVDLRVVNRGRSGEDAPEELARLRADVVDLHPDLAIWQVGTNAVLRRDNLVADAEWLREGVELLKRNGIDVVLMDMQFAPKVVERPVASTMETLIAHAADEQQVGLYRRYALMRYWLLTHPDEAAAVTGPDGLHMTDLGYGCLASDLAGVLSANWLGDAKIAQRVRNLSPAAIGLRTEPTSEPGRLRETSALRPNDARP